MSETMAAAIWEQWLRVATASFNVGLGLLGVVLGCWAVHSLVGDVSRVFCKAVEAGSYHATRYRHLRELEVMPEPEEMAEV